MEEHCPVHCCFDESEGYGTVGFSTNEADHHISILLCQGTPSVKLEHEQF